MKCKLCNKEAAHFDSWFTDWVVCDDHKHISPVELQRILRGGGTGQ